MSKYTPQDIELRIEKVREDIEQLIKGMASQLNLKFDFKEIEEQQSAESNNLKRFLESYNKVKECVHKRDQQHVDDTKLSAQNFNKLKEEMQKYWEGKEVLDQNAAGDNLSVQKYNKWKEELEIYCQTHAETMNEHENSELVQCEKLIMQQNVSVTTVFDLDETKAKSAAENDVKEL